MRRHLLLLIALILLSCSKDDGPEYVPDPWEEYFKISEGESKVDSFTIVFQGSYSVNYTIYDSELDEDLKQQKKKVMATGTIEVEGTESFTRDTGFVVFEYKIRDLKKKGRLKLIYNTDQEAVPFRFVDNLNMESVFLIPYKFRH